LKNSRNQRQKILPFQNGSRKLKWGQKSDFLLKKSTETPPTDHLPKKLIFAAIAMAPFWISEVPF
jgi:hypothetical protein